MELNISNIYTRIIADCQNNAASMACTLVGHKIYNFSAGDAQDYIEMDPEYGTIFKSGVAQMTNDYVMKHYGGASDESISGFLAVSGDYIYLAASEASDAVDVHDVVITKIDIDGVDNIINTADDLSTVWNKHYGGWSDDWSAAITVSGNDVYFTACQYSDKTGGALEPDLAVVKLDASNGTTEKTPIILLYLEIIFTLHHIRPPQEMPTLL